MDVLRIEGLKVDCVVGIYPHERNASQPLEIEIELFLDTDLAARKERVRHTVDYAAVAAQVRFLLQSGRFRMLETAAHAIARYLLLPPAAGEERARLERVRLRLVKPGALTGYATPSLTIERDARWADDEGYGAETKPWGSVDVVYETKNAGIYRLNVAAGSAIPLHVHRTMRESEMVLTAGILCQGREVAPGTVHRWPRGAAHRYDNPTDRVQSILCVDAPRFLPEDEVEVQGEPTDVMPEPPWGPWGGR